MKFSAGLKPGLERRVAERWAGEMTNNKAETKKTKRPTSNTSKPKAGQADSKHQPDEAGSTVRWAGKESLGERLAKGLGELKETLESGERLEERYTMRTVTLDLRPEEFDAARVRKLRELLKASQAVFAELLGASAKTVQSWESGQEPGPMARRLLETIERDPQHWIDLLEAGRREHEVA